MTASGTNDFSELWVKLLSEISVRGVDDMFKLGEYVYNESTIHLNRKKDTYNLFLEHYNLKQGNT